jgi:N-acetylmuramoyl-L-alanine amidase
VVADKGVSVMHHKAKLEKGKTVIVLDAGHGGFDPGKIGINGAHESEINLSIVKKLKVLLEQNGFEVILTRKDDKGLYEEGDSNKKRTDMKKRVDIINGSGVNLAVSIHQNSFEQASSKGAQVFYHEKSLEGKELAEIIQKQIKDTIGDKNHRVPKSNENYYMLKKSICPLVIVECGFLSNPEEAQLLCTDAYQEKMAWAIHLGIIQYLNKQNESDGD